MRALDQAAVLVLEKALADLRNGALSVAHLGTVDEERFVLRLECVAPDQVPGEEPAPAVACPKCNGGPFTDAGGGELVCLSCSHNWSPGRPRKEG